MGNIHIIRCFPAVCRYEFNNLDIGAAFNRKPDISGPIPGIVDRKIILRYRMDFQMCNNPVFYKGLAQFHSGHNFPAAIKHFQIPKDRLGVPTLIIDTEVLVGTDEIMMVFPKLIEDFLAQGGMDWPKIPGFHKTIFKTPAPANKVESAELLQMPTVELSLTEKLARDPIGNGLAIFVLIGMIFVIFHTLVLFKHPNSPLKATKIVPILCLLGLAVSSYMVYIEMYHLTAVCGPIGDCNMVQQSEYAKLFGILPIGILGFIAYIAILLAWSIGQYASEKIAQIGRLTLFGLTLLGTLFSIYLTFLEPFVIGATCLWCLTSAIIMTSLLWNTRAIK